MPPFHLSVSAVLCPTVSAAPGSNQHYSAFTLASVSPCYHFSVNMLSLLHSSQQLQLTHLCVPLVFMLVTYCASRARRHKRQPRWCQISCPPTSWGQLLLSRRPCIGGLNSESATPARSIPPTRVHTIPSVMPSTSLILLPSSHDQLSPNACPSAPMPQVTSEMHASRDPTLSALLLAVVPSTCVANAAFLHSPRLRTCTVPHLWPF